MREIRKFTEWLGADTPKVCKLFLCNASHMKAFDGRLREFPVPAYYVDKEIYVCYKYKRMKTILISIAHEYKHFLQELKHGVKLSKVYRAFSACLNMEFQADMYAGKKVKRFLSK